MEGEDEFRGVSASPPTILELDVDLSSIGLEHELDWGSAVDRSGDPGARNGSDNRERRL